MSQLCVTPVSSPHPHCTTFLPYPGGRQAHGRPRGHVLTPLCWTMAVNNPHQPSDETDWGLPAPTSSLFDFDDDSAPPPQGTELPNEILPRFRTESLATGGEA
jgi:hypothetical protein